MSAKFFLDTNIWIYAYSDNESEKRTKAYQIIDQGNCITSIQVLNETCNVWKRKFSWNADKIKKHLNNIEFICDDVLPIDRSTINMALYLSEKYKYSYYDSIMLASAQEGNCSVFYSEDMSNGQLIEEKLRIVNPFAV